MLGAIVGDVVGSRFEGCACTEDDFELFTSECAFTDDTVLTVAVAEWLVGGGCLRECLQEWFAKYPQAGFGMKFILWAGHHRTEPYNSWGNGSAMRVSPVGFAFDSLEETLFKAEESAAVTHNHEDGIRGAKATAAGIFLARKGSTKSQIRNYIEETFGYDLSRTLDEIRPTYKCDESCNGSVPESIISFLESHSYESAIRNAICLGGDTDTMAAIAGGIAEAYYGGVPEEIATSVLEYLDDDLKAVFFRYTEWCNGSTRDRDT